MNEPRAKALPVLVLGLGNLLLRDDALGLRLLQELAARRVGDARVEFVDGGTQGLALVALLADRPAVLILDAMQLGAEPGTVHRLDDVGRRPQSGNAGGSGGAHQMNAGDLLLTSMLLGELPERVAIVGIEPAVVRTGIELSPAVVAAIPAAVELADSLLQALLPAEVQPCTN